MYMTINSRLYGVQEFRTRGVYVYLCRETDNSPVQICEGGGFMGETVSVSRDNEAEFVRLCRAWWKSWVATQAEAGHPTLDEVGS